jgi:hypothetical protein
VSKHIKHLIPFGLGAVAGFLFAAFVGKPRIGKLPG